VQQILEFRPQHMLQRAVGSRSYSPFVGREAEMAMLRTRWAQVQYGQGHVVSVVGEPGMGKSRLLHEFRQELASETVRVLPCRGQSHGSNSPYLPIRDLVRTIFSLADTDAAETIRAKVRAGCQEARLNADALESLIGLLLGLPVTGEALADLSPDVLKTRTFEALHHLFLGRSQQQPYIIEVENAHWIDATSEAYLSALIERLAGTPLLLLMTFRPGYRPTWLDKSYVTQIALQPLSPLHSRQVMQAVLGSGSLAETIGPQLLAKAEGNPLFLEELARTVAEQGGSQPALAVPDTIHAVLAARIDRLAPAEKQILQAAAVIGQQVSVSLLQTICGLPHSDLQHLLMQLQAGEFLYETQLVPESVYTFKHALTHEVTYANLLREQRRRLHARIVEALETQGDAVHLDDQLEVLAHHALGAGLWDKVCAYFRQAGAKAMTRSAYREAAACFEQALYGLSHLPGSHPVSEQAVDLRLLLHVALFRLGEVARSLALLREAEPIAESLDDAGRLGWIISYLSTHCFMAGDAEHALTFSQRAQALAMAGADAALQVDVHLHLGQVHHARGEYAAAVAALEPNIAFLNEAWQQDQVDLATLPGPHSVPWLMMCLAETGAFDQGYRYAAEALRVAAIGERPYEQVAVYGSVGVLALRHGDLSRAIPELERAVALCQTAGIPHLLPMGMAHLGATYTLSGRLPEAISLLQQAIAQGAAMGIKVCQALAHVYLGRAYLQTDQRQEAREHVLTALDLCEVHHEQGHKAWALHLLGDLTARDQADAIEAAEDIYRQAITQAKARGMRPLLAHCHFSLANLYHQHGQPTQADAERSTALTLYRSMDMAFWLSRIDSALA
jgi:tetratricopeptide (TPR) repeat protein